MTTATERRRYPRLDDEGFDLDVTGAGFDLVAHTLNISASGMYCKVERELSLMSRVGLKLKIPSGADLKNTSVLDVTGVVVRQHPVIIDGKTKHYDVAIFFDDLSEKDRSIISAYIENRKR